ncbi:MAG: DUF4442 domain-containing protein [Flavobacteriaceae bacterium]|nr:DUF4442 domain-containing protein [Flavobacteriaceae bacterium]
MKISPRKLNLFLMLKLPAAYFSGVRATHLDESKCIVKVRHRWINQNPFKSMFWAVQGMAAELSTGALMLLKIKKSKQNISMLVANNKASFSKKATGKITFQCDEGHLIDGAIDKAIATGEGQTLWLHAKGIDEKGDEVSSFNFEWSIKLKP